MTQGTWISLLARQSTTPIGWDEVVVGHDFGLLLPEEIQRWALEQGFQGPGCQELAALDGERLSRFEESLWAACAECTGKVPRPGGNRWAKAQDRWRVALLRDALEAPLSPEALAIVVESIFDWPGIGSYTVQAILTADTKVMLAITLVVGLIYTVVNILTDLLLGLIDPRIWSRG